MLEILATRTRAAYPFVLQTTLNKGGLILEWPPKKNFQPPPTHTHTYTCTHTRTFVALSRNPPRGQIALRGVGVPSCIRVSRWCMDTCSTSDYPAMTLAVFHSLSISTRLNLHLVKSADHSAWISIHLLAANQIVSLP